MKYLKFLVSCIVLIAFVLSDVQSSTPLNPQNPTPQQQQRIKEQAQLYFQQLQKKQATDAVDAAKQQHQPKNNVSAKNNVQTRIIGRWVNPKTHHNIRFFKDGRFEASGKKNII